MKPAQIFIIFFLTLSVIFLVFMLMPRPPQPPVPAVVEQAPVAQNNQMVEKLEAQVQQLKEMSLQVEQSQAVLKSAFEKERERVMDLQEKLWKSISQNKGLARKLLASRQEKKKAEALQQKLDETIRQNEVLIKELAAFQRQQEIVKPVKEKLSQIESALSVVSLKPGKELELKVQLEVLTQEVQTLEKTIIALAGGNPDLVAVAGQPSQEVMPVTVPILGEDEVIVPKKTYQKLQQDLVKLQEQMESLNKDYYALSKEYKSAKEELLENQEMVNTRAEKILALQEKAGSAEEQLEKLRLQSAEMSRETAGLREKYVSLQIERDNLILELASARNRLIQVQEKLSQIGSISQSAPEKSKTRTGRSVDVELLPDGKGDPANAR